ncbi:MAG: hypothetical protein HOK41_11890 [Nitrospina sp.]|nr:hypothetical protein [Nitrospina sp.]
MSGNNTGTKDARTIIVELPEYPVLIGENIKVRINGIQVPSLKGKCKKESKLAVRAKNFTEKNLKKSTLIDLLNMKRGIYFLIIADVQIDEEDFATKLIDKGYAVKTSRKKKAHNWCK